MQTVLKQLGQQQSAQTKSHKHSPRQQLDSGPPENKCLIQKLKLVVAEKDAIIKELREKQQLSNKVKKKKKLKYLVL